MKQAVRGMNHQPRNVASASPKFLSKARIANIMALVAACVSVAAFSTIILAWRVTWVVHLFWIVSEAIAVAMHIWTANEAVMADREVKVSAIAGAVWAAVGMTLAAASLALLLTYTFLAAIYVSYSGHIVTFTAVAPAWSALLLAKRARSLSSGLRDVENLS